jgi:hypothetical protein
MPGGFLEARRKNAEIKRPPIRGGGKDPTRLFQRTQMPTVIRTDRIWKD